MSTGEGAGPALLASGDVSAAGGSGVQGASRRPVRSWLRFFRSELRLVFGRKRNMILLVVTALFPLLIGIALRVAAPHSGNGGGGGNGPVGSFFNQLAGNGVFLAFIALSSLLILVLPVVVAVVALVVGAVLFPIGPVTLLSGDTVPLADGLLRLFFVTLYVTAAMAALGAVGLAISTLTEHPIGAIAAVMILVVASEVVDSVPQLAAVGPYLPTHWWLGFDSLLRAPVDSYTLLHGLLSFGVYLVLFGSFAWARFTSADVTS